MIDSIKSETVTEGIQIEAFAQYIESESKPNGNQFAFVYKIKITNVGNAWAKLLNRYWLIINSEGSETKVKGPGVVGYYPELEHGQEFEYSSWSPLDTEWGTMEGYFEFLRKDGSTFKAMINRFYLTTAAKLTIE